MQEDDGEVWLVADMRPEPGADADFFLNKGKHILCWRVHPPPPKEDGTENGPHFDLQGRLLT